VLIHARLLTEAFDAGNLKAEQRHAEHLINIIEGAQGEHFGDSDGDGKVQNPGDGFGLLQNGQQLGYIEGMVGHALLAAEAQDATDNIKTHAGSVQTIGETIRARVTDIRDRALKVGQAGTPAETQQDVLAILELARHTIEGVDANHNGQIEAIPDEGGVLTAYQSAQFMADIRLAPGTTDEAPPPKQVTQAGPPPITIAIQDNAFVPRKLTIPVGATVIWQNQGSGEHTVTNDSQRFNSGPIPSGDSVTGTFTNPDTYYYFCSFHGGIVGEGMAGTVIVSDRSAAGQP
jgi:plastocyanin